MPGDAWPTSLFLLLLGSTPHCRAALVKFYFAALFAEGRLQHLGTATVGTGIPMAPGPRDHKGSSVSLQQGAELV